MQYEGRVVSAESGGIDLRSDGVGRQKKSEETSIKVMKIASKYIRKWQIGCRKRFRTSTRCSGNH